MSELKTEIRVRLTKEEFIKYLNEIINIRYIEMEVIDNVVKPHNLPKIETDFSIFTRRYFGDFSPLKINLEVFTDTDWGK